MLKTFLLAVFTLAALQLSAGRSLAADPDGPNLVYNPGFEEGISHYYIAPAEDSKSMNCRFSVDKQTFHSGAQSALMQADDFARVAIGAVTPIPVVTAERYRIGVWVKPGSDFQMQPGTPGLVMRLNLSFNGAASAAGLIFILLNNTVYPADTPPYAPLPVTAPLSSTDWTHIEAVVEVPPNVDSFGPVLYFWRAKGSLNVDDFTVEKVDPTTPLSTIATGTP